MPEFVAINATLSAVQTELAAARDAAQVSFPIMHLFPGVLLIDMPEYSSCPNRSEKLLSCVQCHKQRRKRWRQKHED